jgi:hypothetical protein
MVIRVLVDVTSNHLQYRDNVNAPTVVPVELMALAIVVPIWKAIIVKKDRLYRDRLSID